MSMRFDPSISSRLPTPEQLVLQPLNEMELTELIEKYICYVDGRGNPVHLPSNFVKHYLRRDDGDKGLPIVSTVAQLPIVLPNGEILTGRGLNRKYGIIFRVPQELEDLIPSHKECTPRLVGEAIRFLANEWLCDVTASARASASSTFEAADRPATKSPIAVDICAGVGPSGVRHAR